MAGRGRRSIVTGASPSGERAAEEAAVVEVPVLVVGAGPTGLTTSILLSRWGIPSLTVERHPGTTIFPRAIAVNTALRRLKNPEPDFYDRIHLIAASSMLSHGVD